MLDKLCPLSSRRVRSPLIFEFEVQLLRHLIEGSPVSPISKPLTKDWSARACPATRHQSREARSTLSSISRSRVGAYLCCG